MTRTRGQRGRHRRNRDRAPEALNPEVGGGPPVDQAAASNSLPEAIPDRSDDGSRREAALLRRPPETQRGPRPAPDRPQPATPLRVPGSVQPGSQRPGAGRGNRRRSPRRQQSVPMTNQVFKARAPISGSTRPVIRRRLDVISGPEGPILGCPMLTRTRVGLPVTGAQPAPRCALAWALHSELEASYCMETPDLTQCWKVHPERLEDIRARLEEGTAAD